MAVVPSGFAVSHEPEPHLARTKAIVRAHPEIRQWIGRNRWSFVGTLGAVVLHLAMAAWIADRPWWVLLLVAYVVGAVISHSLFVMIHESAHKLIFKSPILNILNSYLANIPTLLPSAISFKKYHLAHHAHQGDYELDADIPSTWEADLVGKSALRKAIWLFFFPILTITRTMRVKEVRSVDRWVVLNWLVVGATDVLIWVFLGPKAFAYLLASFVFAAGLHPVGARWIQRHYLMGSPEETGSDQETFSYYGPMNRLQYNIGYHNEHHDFPAVPWNHLPKIRTTAPEQYDDLLAHQSWAKLLYRFVFSPEISLYSRMLRDEDEVLGSKRKRTALRKPSRAPARRSASQ